VQTPFNVTFFFYKDLININQSAHK